MLSTRSLHGALLALAALSVAACGSPVVGLECRDGFERCGLACYDLEVDNANCGGCNMACGEGQQCVAGACEFGYYADGGRIPDGGPDGGPNDGGNNRGDGGDGGDDMDARVADGGDAGDMDANLGDAAVRTDGGGGDAGLDARTADASNPIQIPDGATVLPDGAIILPDGAIFDPGAGDDGGTGLPDGAVSNPGGDAGSDDAGSDDAGESDSSLPPLPPPLCTGVGLPTDPLDCVCDLGQTKCYPKCVNTLTDHDNCTGCGIVCAADEYCNGVAGCALVCTPPLTLCNGQCVDFSNDDANCGGCNNACGSAAACIPDNATMMGQCVGEAVGHIVVIGHDMTVVTRPIRQMVGNAVFLAPRNPVRILAYDAATAVPSRVGVSLAIQQSSAAIGRAYTLTTADPTNVTQQLGDADVFVIETQQGATDLELQTLGAGWSTALHTFLFRGGVILLFDGGAGNNGTYQILNSATAPVVPPALTGVPLFDATGRQPLSQRILSLVAAADAIGAAVPTEYQSQLNTVGFTDVPSGFGTKTTVVVKDVLSANPPTVPPNLPVVIHTVTSQ
ncbi:MAG: Tryptophan synthase alpha chain [Myxococcaceae bacterium]|nr:Tryptophan synthase alpha chain [Myxococcaceae bacterium]